MGYSTSTFPQSSWNDNSCHQQYPIATSQKSKHILVRVDKKEEGVELAVTALQGSTLGTCHVSNYS